MFNKIFESLLQMNCYVKKLLSPNFFSYRKGCITKEALISLIEKWKTNWNNGYGGTIFMNFSKAFDIVTHELFLAKLHADGLNNDTLKTIHNYLKKRYQTTEINKVFSSCKEILLEVLQGSALGPLLFNIYLSDLIYLT